MNFKIESVIQLIGVVSTVVFLIYHFITFKKEDEN